MNADTITLTGLEDLAALMAESVHAVRLIRLRAESGDISPAEAAGELKPVLDRIANLTP